MTRFKNILVTLAALALVSCGAQEGVSSSESSGPSSSSASTAPKSVFTVSFYDGKTLLSTAEVEEGDLVSEPADPSKAGFDFKGWYIDPSLSEKYDFATPVTESFSLYASFSKTNYFECYNGDYLPTYSALSTEMALFQNQKDVELVFAPNRLLDLSDAILPDMVRLSGAFEGLSVSAVSLKDGQLHIATKGELVPGTGVIVLARETNAAGAYLTASVSVGERHAEIDASTYRRPSSNGIDFTIAMKNINLKNDAALSKDDYKAKANSGEIPLFSIDLPDRYSLQLIELSDDFTAFRLRLTSAVGDISAEIIQELTYSVLVHINGEALSDGISKDFKVDLLHYNTQTTLNVHETGTEECAGSFQIKFLGCRLTETFKNNIGGLLASEQNKNFVVSFPGVDTTLTKLEAVDDTTLKGEFTFPKANLGEGNATIALGEFTVPDSENKGHFAKNWFDDQDVIPEGESLAYVIEAAPETGGGTGTVTQSGFQSYKVIKSAVEESAFKPTEDAENDLTTVISAATNIGKIGYGLYSGDFSTAKDGAGHLLGIDDLIDPSTRILSSLASVYDKLMEIEAKIDSIISNLDVIQAELEQIGQQSILTNYLSAHSAWKDFVTDYYIPLKNAIVAYSNDYFRYFFNLVLDSYNRDAGKEPAVTLYYDTEGNLSFPGRNPSLSIDGKSIDKSATKVVHLPQLSHSLVGVLDNDGHVYPAIEEDIIADLFSYGTIDEELIADIIKTIRFRAMQDHFSSASELDSFTNTFSNFCTAFTSTEFGTTLNATITPLDCYRVMLETVYNFGFEIEPEFNIAITKIESTYYCARSILDLVQLINSGEFISTRYDDLDKSVQKEFTDERFYHPNIDSKTIYCYGTASYLTWNLEAYGISIQTTGDYDSGYGEDYYINRAENFSLDNHDKPAGLTTIDEASVRLMGLKVKLYNNLKGTAYNLGEYLTKIGVIPQDKAEKTLGIILSIDGFEDDDDDIEDMRFPANWMIDTDRKATLAFKGKAYSFADGDVVNGLVAITYNYMSTSMGSYVGPGDITNVGYVEGGGWSFGVWAYYLNFLPAAV